MPRPRRKPRPTGNVVVVCTGRGRHARIQIRRRPLQLVVDGDRVRVIWDHRDGPPPVTGYRDAAGYRTFEFRCGRCGRHQKFQEPRLVDVARVLAIHQGLVGDDTTPIELDISAVERW